VRLLRLRAEHLRLFEAVELVPHSRISLLTGPNGAGKTSLLEALHLLGYGRSFRAGPRDAVVRRGADSLALFAEIDTGAGTHRLGLRRSAREWEARLDSAPVAALSDLFRYCPLVLFEPGSHELISGPAELRRRFLDWGLFHVEQDFMPSWRRYQRALKQRNAMLRSGAGGASLAPWEAELGRSGNALHAQRVAYCASLQQPLEAIRRAIFPSAGAAELRYQPGWRAGEVALEDTLAENRDRDLALGYTMAGPHRANWTLRLDAIPERESLSRGQEKLAALCCLLAQASLFAADRGEWPLLCLDDLASELDRVHQALAFDWLASVDAQALVTGTELPPGLSPDPATHGVFHVEQASVHRLL